MLADRAEEQETPTDRCCARGPVGDLAWPGSLCQEFLPHLHCCVSSISTLEDHGALLQALLKLYDIFLECACPLRGFFGNWTADDAAVGRL